MREVIVRESSKIKKIEKTLGNKAEDIFLSLILLLPEKMLPESLIEKYLQKRKAELESEKVKNTWRKIDLEIAQQAIYKNRNPK